MSLDTRSNQIRWNQGSLEFHLRCNDQELTRRAQTVFRYWRTPLCAAPAETCVMQSERIGDRWRFRGSQADSLADYPDVATVIRAAETDAALAVLNRHDQFLTAHGALLAAGDDAVLIVGPSESGKSTIACALWAAGWQLLSDDVTILDANTHRAWPLLRRVSLRHPSRELLDEKFWRRMVSAESCDATPDGFIFHPDELQPESSRARSARLRAILFLSRLNVPSPPPAQLRPIPNVRALLALSPYTNVVRHCGLGECMTRLGGLMNSVPSYDFGRGPLPNMIDSVQQLIHDAPRFAEADK